MICISKLENRINKLKEGHTLRFIHEGFNYDVIIKMNPQQNRIYVCTYLNDNTDITESLISHFLLWDFGNWLLVEEPPKEEFIKVLTEGKYAHI